MRNWACGIGAVAVLAACSSTVTNNGAGAGTGDGGAGNPGAPAQRLDVAEKEPNNDEASAQDLGSLSTSTTLVLTGKLETGGNDGTQYTGDWDVFSLTFGAAGKAEIVVDWDSGADVDFALYDGSKKEVASEGATAKPAKGTASSVNGKYLLALFSKDQPASYTVTITYTVGSTPVGGGDCPTTPVEAAAPTGGCTITLSTPACSTADLTGGKTFELAWSTNQSFCEGPHKIQIGGDPPSSWTTGNAIEISLSSKNPDERSGMTRNIGGYLNINASDLQNLTSASGVYYYRVLSFYGSASEVRAFKVVK